MTSVHDMTWRARDQRREGVISGLLGAIVVALFYFVIDVSRGQPLMTPSVLGEVLVLRTPITATPNPAAIFIYTTLHGVAFIVLGTLLSRLMRAADRSALARYAMVQLLVVFEVFFYGVLSIVSERARGLFPFTGVLAANTLAAGAMVAWQWRHHPAIRLALDREPLGANQDTHAPTATVNRY